MREFQMVAIMWYLNQLKIIVNFTLYKNNNTNKNSIEKNICVVHTIKTNLDQIIHTKMQATVCLNNTKFILAAKMSSAILEESGSTDSKSPPEDSFPGH